MCRSHPNLNPRVSVEPNVAVRFQPTVSWFWCKIIERRVVRLRISLKSDVR